MILCKISSTCGPKTFIRSIPAQLTSSGGSVANSALERRVESWHGSSEADLKTVWAVARRVVGSVMLRAVLRKVLTVWTSESHWLTKAWIWRVKGLVMVGRRQGVWRLLVMWEKKLEGKAVVEEMRVRAMVAVVVVGFMMVVLGVANGGRVDFCFNDLSGFVLVADIRMSGRCWLSSS